MKSSKPLIDQLNDLTTEQRNPVSMDLDARSVTDILSIINREDRKVAEAVEKEIEHIARAVEIVVARLREGGRLIYVGAGSSGRMGVLDAVECPPTFGTDPGTIGGLIAGGEKAMFRAQEGAEDSEMNGARDIDNVKGGPVDVVCGIAASLRTPYVIGAVKRAKESGCATLYVTTNSRTKLYSQDYTELAHSIDVAICPEVGPEVITGSTRMKSGTAQKLVLNMITTASMVRLGKVYENLMIDLQMTNEKLRERGKRIIIMVTGVPYEEAARVLDEAGGHVKTALVMIKAGIGRGEAAERLKKTGGFVREAIKGQPH